MTPDDLWIEMAQSDGERVGRLWEGTAPTEDAPAWYGRVATLLRAAPAPATAEELAGEAEIVARMQAAILEPATADDLAGESDIVARMQATIFELGPAADGGGAGDTGRPRHLRAASSAPGARRRQGIRVVRRIVAVKATAVTTVVAVGVTAAAATTGIVTVVVPALSNHEPKVTVGPESPPSADSESSTDGSGGTGRGVREGNGDERLVAMDPDEPLVCMLDMDCLLHEVEEAAAAGPPAAPLSATPPTTEAPPATPSTTEAPPATLPTTEPPPPPTTTTTAPPPPPTTTTTALPPPDPPPAETMSAPTGDTDGARTTAVDLTAAGGSGSEALATG